MPECLARSITITGTPTPSLHPCGRTRRFLHREIPVLIPAKRRSHYSSVARFPLIGRQYASPLPVLPAITPPARLPMTIFEYSEVSFVASAAGLSRVLSLVVPVMLLV